MADFPFSFNTPISGNKKLDSALAANFRAAAADNGVAHRTVSNIPPVGVVMAYGNSTAPDGWLVCDGSAVSRETYDELFDVIGTTFGNGDGSTTFNVPNLLGRVIVGAGSAGTGGGATGVGLISGGTALTARALGAWTGAQTHLLTSAESGQKAVNTGTESADHTHSGTTGGMSANHTHLVTIMAGTGPYPGGVASSFHFGDGTHPWYGGLAYTEAPSNGHVHGFSTGGRSAAHTHGISGSGAASAHNNVQPQLALYYIIKASSLGLTGVSSAVDSSDPRLSDSRAPMGSAGGHLTGTYPNPSIANAVITDAHISSLTASSIDDWNTAVLAAQSQIDVKAEGVSVGIRRGINFVSGGGMEITVTDDAANEEVDIELAFAGSANLDGGFSNSTYDGIETYDGGGA